MKLQLADIASAVHGELIGADLCITGVSIDTRTLVAGELYVALSGKNFDGHDFLESAAVKGAVAVLVEHAGLTDLPQIVVKDSHLALAELAGFWRSQCRVKVVGVTGSNGKTTTKELVAAILATRGSTLYTRGNLNNEIGVPLTLLKLDEQHAFAVVEMGANHPGEIAYTSRYAKPDISIITNVGAAHIEGFGSIEGVARSKAEIIASLGLEGVAILNRDDDFYPLWQQLAGERQIVSFGLDNTATVWATDVNTVLTSHGFTTRFTLMTADAWVVIALRLAGEHNVKNALAAAAAAMQLGFSLSEIQSGLESVKPVTGRMQPLLGRKGHTVIDDTYNANPASLLAALDVLDDQAENWLVLGAFGELGLNSAEIHREMGDLIKAKPVQRLFATGELAKHTVDAFGVGGQFFNTQEQLILALNQALTGRETVLVKGSRSQKMENVVASLVDNFRAE